MKSEFNYYIDRIRFAMRHDFANREELLRMISRVAFMDSYLTGREYTSILEALNNAHIKSMEMNYNEGWN